MSKIIVNFKEVIITLSRHNFCFIFYLYLFILRGYICCYNNNNKKIKDIKAIHLIRIMNSSNKKIYI